MVFVEFLFALFVFFLLTLFFFFFVNFVFVYKQGNCCFHFERKKPPNCDPCWATDACQPSIPSHSSPACCPPQCLECQYINGVYADPAVPPRCSQFT